MSHAPQTTDQATRIEKRSRLAHTRCTAVSRVAARKARKKAAAALGTDHQPPHNPPLAHCA